MYANVDNYIDHFLVDVFTINMIPAEFFAEYSGESIEETLSDGEHLTATVTPVKIADPQHKQVFSGTDLFGWMI